MTRERLDADQMLRCFEAMGRALRQEAPGREVEIVVVGGAAGILCHRLARRLTSDCDIVDHQPQDAWFLLDQAARTIASERRLAPDWLNAEVRGTRRLPVDWRERLEFVGRFDTLVVRAVGRTDLIAMKLIALRESDYEDLQQLCPFSDSEVAFARAYLDSLATRFPDESVNVEDAEALLEELITS